MNILKQAKRKSARALAAMMIALTGTVNAVPVLAEGSSGEDVTIGTEEILVTDENNEGVKITIVEEISNVPLALYEEESHTSNVLPMVLNLITLILVVAFVKKSKEQQETILNLRKELAVQNRQYRMEHKSQS